MDDALSPLLNALLSLQTPVLPDPIVLRYARLASWALVLAFLVLWFGRGWPRWARGAALLGMLLWMLIPGPWSLALALGLAFQVPSLTSVALSLAGVLRCWRGDAYHLPTAARGVAWRLASAAAIVLGWLLLLDTFALFPFALYAWGFSALAVGLAALLAALPWVIHGTRQGAPALTLLLGAVLLLFVLLRLPNGNLWNALLDPILWLVLQGYWLLRALHWFRARRRAAAATRA